jgi:ABC-type polysaccharide/polyol phosphate transport system ATPase subunit
VEAGQVVGVLGHNGAGKSTLLKIVSGIVRPTRGVVRLKGRVTALLEARGAFSGELDGYENIRLMGALYGLSRREILDVTEAIVEFGGLQSVMERPVKYYSSGMQLRLAFAIAAHTMPDVLVVDEALSVGDGMFQRQCREKIHSLCREGRTVLLVSHHISVIESLCSRVIWLDHGSLVMDGPTAMVLAEYNRKP